MPFFNIPNTTKSANNKPTDKDPRIITLNGKKVRVLGIRRLTPIECARLQTIPSWYNWEGMSDSQRYRVLGNGWTVSVIMHLLSFLPKEWFNSETKEQVENNGNQG